MIIKCGCKHPYQDEVYGQGNRVANPMVKEKTYRCTVCLKEQTKGSGDEKKK